MTMIFAMAGMAEAGAAAGICVGYLTYILVAAFSFLGMLSRRRMLSRVLIVIALAIALLDAGMFHPWEAFASFKSDDPDAISLMKSARTLAYWWLATMGLLLVAAARYIIVHRRVADRHWAEERASMHQ